MNVPYLRQWCQCALGTLEFLTIQEKFLEQLLFPVRILQTVRFRRVFVWSISSTFMASSEKLILAPHGCNTKNIRIWRPVCFCSACRMVMKFFKLLLIFNPSICKWPGTSNYVEWGTERVYLYVDESNTSMPEMVDPLLVARMGFTLCQFVVMMRKTKILPTGMNVEIDTKQITNTAMDKHKTHWHGVSTKAQIQTKNDLQSVSTKTRTTHTTESATYKIQR